MALLGFLPTTLCRSVIRTHIELHRIETFEGRSTDWATALRLLMWRLYVKLSSVLGESLVLRLTAPFGYYTCFAVEAVVCCLLYREHASPCYAPSCPDLFTIGRPSVFPCHQIPFGKKQIWKDLGSNPDSLVLQITALTTWLWLLGLLQSSRICLLHVHCKLT